MASSLYKSKKYGCWLTHAHTEALRTLRVFITQSTGPAASPVVFPPHYGYLSNGVRKQTPQNWPFLRPALWHSGKFSHTDEGGELEPDLELELPCEQFTVRCFWLGCPSSPLSPTVPFVPTHKPMSFKRPQMTLGNVVVGVGGEFKMRQFHSFSFSILWLQDNLTSHFKTDFFIHWFICLFSGVYRATLRN